MKRIVYAVLILAQIGFSAFFSKALALPNDSDGTPDEVKEAQNQENNRQMSLLNDALEEGRIPEWAAERWRIVPLDTPEAKQFQVEMEALIKRLFPDYDFSKAPVRFLLLADQKLNAFGHRYGKPPIIAVSTGILSRVTSTDELACVVGHEWTHKKFTENFGADLRNSKGEEIAADLLPLVAMADAEFDPRAALNFYERLFATSKTDFTQFFDVHLSDTHRIKALRTGVAYLDKNRGGFLELKETPLTPTILEIRKRANDLPYIRAGHKNPSHLSFIDQMLEDSQFKELSIVEKLGFLTHLVDDKENWTEDRVDDLVKTIRLLKIDRSDPEQKDAQNSLANSILDMAQKNADMQPWAENLYGLLSRAHNRGLKNTPIGKLEPLSEDIRRFIEAKDFDAAKDAAQRLLTTISEEPLPPEFLSRNVDWPQFEFPDVDTFTESARKQRKRFPPVSWNRFIAWAHKDRSETILRALFALNVDDIRLYDNFYSPISAQLAHERLHGKLPCISKSPREGSITIHHIELDKNGRLEDVHTSSNLLIERRKEVLRSLDYGDLDAKFKKAVQGDKDAETELRKIVRENPVASSDELMGLECAEKNFDLFVLLNERTLSRFDLKNASKLVSRFSELLKTGRSEDKEVIRSFYFKELAYLGFGKDNLGYPLSNHPYIRFLFQNPDQVFSKEEQLKILSDLAVLEYEVTVDNSDGQKSKITIDEMNYTPFRNLLGYECPKTNEELFSLIERFGKGSPLEKRMLVIDTYLYFGASNLEKKDVGKNSGELRKFDIDRYLALVDPNEIREFPALRARLRDVVADKENWFTEPQKLVNQWRAIHDTNLFPEDNVLRWRVLSKALAAIANADSTDEKIRLLEHLLFGNRIQDPYLRHQSMELWLDAIHEKYGFDHENASYAENILAVVRRVKAGMNFSDMVILISKLTQRLQTQEALTDKIKKVAFDVDKETIEGSQRKGMISELILEVCQTDPKAMNALIEFLVSPLTEDSLEKIVDEFKEFLRDMEIRDPITERKVRISVERTKAEAKLTWQNFWAAPFLARAAILEDLLFPNAVTTNDHLKTSFEYVMSKLIPVIPDMQDFQIDFPDNPHAVAARKFLRAYFEVIPDYQKTLFLAALLVAAEKTVEADYKSGIGERLSLLLETLGPAETKLGQIIHSHPKTPDDIRRDMQRLKMQADEPLRWDLMELYQKNVPQEVRHQVGRIKNVLGSASYYVAFEVEMKNGENNVLVVLRPYALKRSENGFRLMREMLNRIHIDDQTLEIVRQMVDQAQNLASLETDSTISAQQTKIARSIYESSGIEVNGEKFNLHVPKILVFGKTFRLMEKAPGEHFNDLPENTPEQRARKTSIAKAYLAYELHLILGGGHFDHDRHGAQMRIDGNDIYLFDFGAMALELPTTKERQQLGHLLFAAFDKIQRGEDFSLALFEEIKKKERNGEDVAFLLKIQKALVTLGDFQRHIDSTALPGIFKAAFQAGVHPDIAMAFMEEISASGMDSSRFLSTESACTIIRHRPEQPLQPELETKRTHDGSSSSRKRRARSDRGEVTLPFAPLVDMAFELAQRLRSRPTGPKKTTESQDENLAARENLLRNLAERLYGERWQEYMKTDGSQKVIDVDKIKTEAAEGKAEAQVFLNALRELEEGLRNMTRVSEERGVKLAKWGVGVVFGMPRFMISLAIADSLWSVVREHDLDGLRAFIDQSDEPEFYYNYLTFSAAASGTEAGYLYLKGANQFVHVNPKLASKAMARGLLAGQAAVTYFSAIRHHPDYLKLVEDPANFELIAKIAQDVFFSKTNAAQAAVGATSFWSAIKIVELTVHYGKMAWRGTKVASNAANTNPLTAMARLTVIFLIDRVLMEIVNTVFPYEEWIHRGKLDEAMEYWKREILEKDLSRSTEALLNIHQNFEMYRQAPLQELYEMDAHYEEVMQAAIRYTNNYLINLERVAKIENYQEVKVGNLVYPEFSLDGERYNADDYELPFGGVGFPYLMKKNGSPFRPIITTMDIRNLMQRFESERKYAGPETKVYWAEEYLKRNSQDPRIDEAEMALIQYRKLNAEKLMAAYSDQHLTEIEEGLWRELWEGKELPTISDLKDQYIEKREDAAKEILEEGHYKINEELVQLTRGSKIDPLFVNIFRRRMDEAIDQGEKNRLLTYYEEIRFLKDLASELKDQPEKVKLIEEEIERVLEQWQLHELQVLTTIAHRHIPLKHAERMGQFLRAVINE